MPASHSIREDVLSKLQAHLPELRDRYHIEIIGIFGSVARGDDTPDSDVDIFYRIVSGKEDYNIYLDLYDYLEILFSRKVDLVPLDNMQPYFKKYVEPDMIYARAKAAQV